MRARSTKYRCKKGRAVLASLRFASLPLLGACAALAPRPRATAPDVMEEARTFDQQGVRAFEAGRYHDALLYFDAAFAHGGPASERWNRAKCHLRLDQAEEAEADLTSYLALPGLTAADRQEAEATLSGIRRRPSLVTVWSSPVGLPVTIDSSRQGVTPLSLSLPPGEHTVVVERGAGARDERRVAAHLGRAILIEARP